MLNPNLWKLIQGFWLWDLVGNETYLGLGSLKLIFWILLSCRQFCAIQLKPVSQLKEHLGFLSHQVSMHIGISVCPLGKMIKYIMMLYSLAKRELLDGE